MVNVNYWENLSVLKFQIQVYFWQSARENQIVKLIVQRSGFETENFVSIIDVSQDNGGAPSIRINNCICFYR